MISNRRFPVADGVTASIDWKCEAIVEDSSVAFAKGLEAALNSNTQEGFSLVQEIIREADHGFVLVFQRVVRHHEEEGKDGSLPTNTH